MTLQPMYPGFANSPKTTITAALSASDATISVADANCLPDGPNYATIGTGDNAEVVKYTGKSGSSLTGVVRGISGVARVWQAGAQIYRAYTDPDHAAFIENINALNDGKLDKTGDAKDATVTASAASSRVNLASGDTLAVIVGKLMKWYADFKALAWKATVGTADIDDNAATNAKLAQMGAGTIKGNAVSATANASDLTAEQARGVILESTSAIDAIADDDKIILQDVSASAGSRTKHVLWSAIKAALRSKTTATLTAAGWSGSPLTQSVTVPGLTADDEVMISPAPGSLESYYAAGVFASSQAAGSITFTAGRDPLGALTVNIKIGR